MKNMRSATRLLGSWIVMLLAWTIASAALAATKVPGPLVDTGWLAAQMGSPGLVVLDVRDDPANFDRQHTDKEKAEPKTAPIVGHVPGARLLDWKQVRETREIDGVKLDKMLLSAESFQKLMRQLGVGNDDTIVVMSNGKDSNSVTMGTRVYWMLKYYSHDNVALLDGGLKKWIAESRPIAHDKPPVASSQFVPGKQRTEMVAMLSDVTNAVKNRSAQLVDGRTADYYVGQNMTSDVKGKGHLPGARMLAHKDIVDEKTGTFLPRAELLAMATDAGLGTDADTITYCNTGHLGSGPWFVISEILGNKKARLYDGSMHEWTKDSSRPITRKWEMN